MCVCVCVCACFCTFAVMTDKELVFVVVVFAVTTVLNTIFVVVIMHMIYTIFNKSLLI